MKKPYPPVYYADYLKLDHLLSTQQLKSEQYGHHAHDEMLFVIIHQVYELWFKQILHELNTVLAIFRQDYVDEMNIGIGVSRLQRVAEIQKILIDQLHVLETMTPLDFLDFRDFLVPASGFQSFQFRLIEHKLGLQQLVGSSGSPSRLSKEHQLLLNKALNESSLFEMLNLWLERTPFLQFEGFDFWKSYREAVHSMLNNDEATISSNPILTERERKAELRELRNTKERFSALFDPQEHQILVDRGEWRLSLKATQAALLINLYRDEPILHLPYRLLMVLMDIDERFTSWRYRHALMVKRMIGSKIGTGGSSGYHYLKQSTEARKIFGDLFNLTTFLIPRSSLPKLPETLRKNLGFYYARSTNHLSPASDTAEEQP